MCPLFRHILHCSVLKPRLKGYFFTLSFIYFTAVYCYFGSLDWKISPNAQNTRRSTKLDNFARSSARRFIQQRNKNNKNKYFFIICDKSRCQMQKSKVNVISESSYLCFFCSHWTLKIHYKVTSEKGVDKLCVFIRTAHKTRAQLDFYTFPCGIRRKIVM